MVDLDQCGIDQEAQSIFRELASGDNEPEVAWRGGVRLASRLVQTTLASHPARISRSRNSGYQLLHPSSGVLDDLALHTIPRRAPRPNEVEVEIQAAALNFRDVMKLLGIYPMDSDLELLLGDECSGRIVRAGSKVVDLKPGDEVIANGSGCFASHLTVPAEYVVRKPARLSFEEAATIPVAFMTAWYALHDLGRIQRGEKILIHSASGGVGLAAIQIARLAGAEIFATAGSEEKRDYLRKLGIRHVMDSRSTAFADEVRRLTKDAGVDLVLNSLAGDAIEKGLSILAPGGRFLEIGKRDIYANTAIGLRPFRNNLSMFVIDMGQVMAKQPHTVQALLQMIVKQFRVGKLTPLPHQTSSVSDAPSAFRLMAQAKHIGKIVLTMQGVKSAIMRAPTQKAIAFPPRASYLITGGLGGFGIEVAKWLVKSGVRNLALMGRTGACSPEAKRAVAQLRRAGAKVLVIKADITEVQQVHRVIERTTRTLGPLRGVFHAATMLDDGLLSQLTEERFARVMAPKVIGAWNLHAATARLKLDHFVMFSSVSALLGTAGQANYAAANCFLDALAHHRRASGLSALTLNWGAIADVGILARDTRVADHLEAHGVHAIKPAVATEMLGRLMQCDIAQIAFMHIDWQKAVGANPNASPSSRFSALRGATLQESSGAQEDLHRKICSAPATEKIALVTSLVSDSVAKVLRISAARIEASRPLKELGLDSLMAFELLNRLEGQFALSLPANRISANSTIDGLVAIILEYVGSEGEKPVVAHNGAQIAAHRAHPAIQTSASHQQIATLRAGGSDTPLFFIHPAGGGTSIYEQLVSELPGGFPVYGIHSRALAGAAEELISAETMGRDYADLIANRQPEGNIQLVGFSAGGVFALEAARSLEHRGRRVSFVALLETPLAMLDPGHSRELTLQSLIEEVLHHFAGEATLSKRQAGEFTEAMLSLFKNTATAQDEAARLDAVMNWLAQQGIATGNGADSQMKRFFAIFIRHLHLVEGASLNAINAPVWLWLASASVLTNIPLRPEMRGRITLGSLVEETLEGRHFELMHPPHVKVLAARMAEVLSRSQQTDTLQAR
jgi:NADPH:quinone reductase-like Zn-dependent oxidoreductase/thioesterase domain-containing protein/short-subunit dehydrogenase/acyl carrier protein